MYVIVTLQHTLLNWATITTVVLRIECPTDVLTRGTYVNYNIMCPYPLCCYITVVIYHCTAHILGVPPKRTRPERMEMYPELRNGAPSWPLSPTDHRTLGIVIDYPIVGNIDQSNTNWNKFGALSSDYSSDVTVTRGDYSSTLLQTLTTTQVVIYLSASRNSESHCFLRWRISNVSVY